MVLNQFECNDSEVNEKMVFNYWFFSPALNIVSWCDTPSWLIQFVLLSPPNVCHNDCFIFVAGLISFHFFLGWKIRCIIQHFSHLQKAFLSIVPRLNTFECLLRVINKRGKPNFWKALQGFQASFPHLAVPRGGWDIWRPCYGLIHSQIAQLSVFFNLMESLCSELQCRSTHLPYSGSTKTIPRWSFYLLSSS